MLRSASHTTCLTVHSTIRTLSSAHNRTFSFVAPIIWNNLPVGNRNCNSLTFKNTVLYCMVLFVKLTSHICCTLNVHILKLNIPHNMLVYNGTVKVSVDFQVYEGLDNMRFEILLRQHFLCFSHYDKFVYL